eukprot:tig00021623_g23018.t1
MQPVAMVPPGHLAPREPQQYSTGLCGCCEDPGSCLISCLCPQIQIGLTAQAFDGSDCCLTTTVTCLIDWVACYLGTVGMGCQYRRKIRRAYNLEPADECYDCLVFCCCNCCAVSQDAREVMKRGRAPVAFLAPSLRPYAPQPVVMAGPGQGPLYAYPAGGAAYPHGAAYPPPGYGAIPTSFGPIPPGAYGPLPPAAGGYTGPYPPYPATAPQPLAMYQAPYSYPPGYPAPAQYPPAQAPYYPPHPEAAAGVGAGPSNSAAAFQQHLAQAPSAPMAPSSNQI